MNTIETSNNYLIVTEGANLPKYFASKESFINVFADKIELRESRDGIATILKSDVDGGSWSNIDEGIFSWASIITFLTEKTGNFSSASGGSGAGVFGISDNTGSYTYYTTFAAAYTAVSANGTIEQFADYSTVDTIPILKPFRLNMNGHLYQHTASAVAFFIQPGIGNRVEFKNGTIIKSSSLEIFSQYDGILNCPSLTLVHTLGGFYVGAGTGAVENMQFSGATCYGASVGIGISVNNGIVTNCQVYKTGNDCIRIQTIGTVRNCIGISTATGNGIRVIGSGIIDNGQFETVSGFAMRLQGATVNNCIGKSTNNNAIWCESGCIVSNSYGWSNLSIGINCAGLLASPSSIHNCTGYSVTGYGIVVSASGSAHNCTGIGQGTFYGMQINLAGSGGITVSGCTSTTANGSGAMINHAGGSWPLSVSNCTFISKGAGPSLGAIDIVNHLSPAARTRFQNNVCVVIDATNCIFRKIGGGTSQLAYVNNTFVGTTNLFTGSFVQVAANIPDAQSNIFNT
jgi:hypothetical protein